ncbi:porin [Lampropedia puyangensis]|uniref:Porin n=1 Tax=Lampropedia puyangensis TaxID=1330072 RepID=A0A4V6T2L6_9BURK|nr:porin [Lampropedia puyangensis]THT97575.1 porin [Lampropedia puyangensis]
MKNYIITVGACAALITGACAHAQVTLYGELDAGVGQRFKEDGQGMITNFDGMSRWGMRGGEDLGSGWKAHFNFESASINLGTGALNGIGGMNRQAWVGLSSGMGSVMLGRTTTPQNRIMGVFDLNGTADGSSALLHVGLAANGSFGGSRQNSQIQYALPKMAGLEARIAYVFKDNRPASANKAFVQAATRYQAGGLTLGATVQGKMSPLSDHRTGYSLGAKYDFGVVAISALYTQRETKSAGKGWGLGAALPLGSLTVGAQVARLTSSGDASYKGATTLELFADYPLSKRTRLYANFGRLNDKARWFNGTVVEGKRTVAPNKQAFATGIVHNF